MVMQFTAPASGNFFKPADANGHLILILTVHEIGKRFDTLRGEEIDQATVDLVDLDGDGQREENVYLTHKGIVSRLKPGATNILGRIGQATTKSGMQAWVLNDATTDEAAVQKATAWVQANPTQQFTQPAAATPPAATAPAPAAATPAVDPNSPELQALLAQLQTQKA